VSFEKRRAKFWKDNSTSLEAEGNLRKGIWKELNVEWEVEKVYIASGIW
jgi:hypothetical protein